MSKARKQQLPQWSQLLTNLGEEERQLGEVVRIVREFRRLLTLNQLEEFEARVSQYGQTMAACQSLRTERTCLLQEIADQFDLKGDRVSLRAISEVVGGDEGQQLQAVCDRLKQLGEEAAKFNLHNAAIVVQSTGIARDVLQRLTNSESGGDCYDAEGSRQDGVSGSMISLDG